MGKLTQKDIQLFSNAFNQVKVRRDQMKLWPNQRGLSTELPESEIYNLQKAPSCNYYLMVNANDSIVPTSTWIFVNTISDPLMIRCANENELNTIYSGPHKFQKVGHTSLTRTIASNNNSDYNKIRIRKALAADCEPLNPLADATYCEDVYLAGEMNFSLEGRLLSWTIESGHYMLNENKLSLNMFPHIKSLLPLMLFEGR